MKKLILVGLAAVLPLLAACSTTQTHTVMTVACAVSDATPAVVAVGGTIATIADPASIGVVAGISAGDRALHPLVQAACASALPGSKPVEGTVTTVAAPVAAP